jgi:hypothetical protein
VGGNGPRPAALDVHGLRRPAKRDAVTRRAMVWIFFAISLGVVAFVAFGCGADANAPDNRCRSINYPSDPCE